MFEILFKFFARQIAVPILQWVRRPFVAGIIFKVGRILRLEPRPPREAAPTAREWAHRPAADGRSFREIYPAQTLQLQAPRSLDGTVHWHFRERLKILTQPVFVATVPGGSVHGAYGSVVSGDGVILGDLAFEWFFKPEQHSLLFKLKLHEPQHLNGTTANVATASGWNYFHWLLDVLPRFGILQKAGVELSEVDWFTLNRGNARFQSESLDWLGIPGKKRLITAKGSHYQAERLLAPSLPGIPSQTPPWVVDWLQRSFPAEDSSRAKKERIYISRARSKYRNFTNEGEVREFLLKRGFREVFAEELSFREQVNLFASAATIVAPHGAGLANLVFCRPGMTVVEIFSPEYVNGCFWVLANWAKLNYFYLLGEGPRPREFVDPHQVEKNISVNLRELEATFRLAGLE